MKDIPNADIVMAGVSLVIPLLLNPRAAEADHRQGFDYVTSQMRYYIEMETLFLPSQMEVDAKSELKLQIRNLYEKLSNSKFEVFCTFSAAGPRDSLGGAFSLTIGKAN